MDTPFILDRILRAVTAPFIGDRLEQTILSVSLAFGLLVVFKLLEFSFSRIFKPRLTTQAHMLVRKVIRYTGYVLICLMVFDWFGINVSAILGAAGIAGVALGFAAQTSVSNLISGVFLIAEKPFAIGDVLSVAEITGTVISIDLLSIKIQTFDNRFVRIPNETIIKSNVTNLTRFPLRRLDIAFTVPYGTDVTELLTLLASVARDDVNVLDNPAPLIFVDKFSPSGIDIFFGIWLVQADLIAAKNSIHRGVLEAMERAGMRIAGPRMDVRIDSANPVQAPGVSPEALGADAVASDPSICKPGTDLSPDASLTAGSRPSILSQDQKP